MLNELIGKNVVIEIFSNVYTTESGILKEFDENLIKLITSKQKLIVVSRKFVLSIREK